MAGQILAYSSLAIGLIGIMLWIKQESKTDYVPPIDRVPPSVYRLLERARERLFCGSHDVRFTIFAPDKQEPDLLRPIARLGWGRPSSLSGIRFQKGEGMAGQAWEHPGALLMARLKVQKGSVQIEPQDTFSFQASQSEIEEKCRNAQRDILKLRRETAAALSVEQLSVHTLIAASLVDCGEWFKGVLCIDFRDSTPKNLNLWERLSLLDRRAPSLVDGLLTDSSFWTGLARLATNLAVILPPRVSPRIEEEDLATRDGSSLKRVRIRETIESQAATA